MATLEITAANFEEVVSREGIVLLDFWASWCGPCRSFAPVFEAAAAKHPDATFGKVNTEAEQQLAGSLGIQAIPTLMVFRDGILLFAEAGALPGSALEKLIEKVRELDMDDVRRRVAQARSEAEPAR